MALKGCGQHREMNGCQMLPNKEGTTTRLWCEIIEPECDQSDQHQLPIYRMYRGEEHVT